MTIQLDIITLVCLFIVWTGFVWAVLLYVLIEHGVLSHTDLTRPCEPSTATLAGQIQADALEREEGRQ